MPAAGSIVLVIQAVGKSTSDLVALAPGDQIDDVVGPLGRPSDLVAEGTAVCVAGGVGAAVMFPIARRLAELGAEVITVLGARTSDTVLFDDEFAAFAELIVCTDDGSSRARRAGHRRARAISSPNESVDVVYAAGPVPMMRAVAAVTRPLGVQTIVSLNPIMVDGTGMCGGCRVTVGGDDAFRVRRRSRVRWSRRRLRRAGRPAPYVRATRSRWLRATCAGARADGRHRRRGRATHEAGTAGHRATGNAHP